VVLVTLLWPLGEKIARKIPLLGNISYSEEVHWKQRGPDENGPYFLLSASGTGNACSFEFDHVHIRWIGPTDKGYLGIYLRQMEGSDTTPYTKHFALTQEKLLSFIHRNDDFTDQEANEIADRAWAFIQKCRYKSDMPPMKYDITEERAIYVYIYLDDILLVTTLLVLGLLIVPSWWLSRRYLRKA
jgi:hypothetical protein